MAQSLIASRRSEIVLVRHGETEWSRSGKHTGRTDVPLSDNGIRMAALVGHALAGKAFGLVLCSPRSRAVQTCRIAGYGASALIRQDLAEWDYGKYEGLTTAEIRSQNPTWNIWDGPVPGGETVEEVGMRCDRIVAEVRGRSDDVAVFAHGHVLRILGARWLSLPPMDGRLFALDTATISKLGYEREQPVIVQWNTDCHLHPSP
jgi:broad specificity phosphatase PhoE